MRRPGHRRVPDRPGAAARGEGLLLAPRVHAGDRAAATACRWGGNSGGECVELRAGLGAVRDSKRPGVVLEFPPVRVAAFLRAVRRGEAGSAAAV
ncbi:DUF397 domain-containing protein [Saccharothrix algeriensis]|uniref:DUF397 domain-containing protein n=1 Tax=Saccharothrix algeriensis TaxID=173560 RepID=UPI0027DB8BD7|nr:DUF397 domain-containing protein [Saccharothrix algeriensis]